MESKRLTSVLVLLGSILVLMPKSAFSADTEPKTEEEKTVYALGVVLSRNLGGFALNDSEVALVKSGISDGLTGKAKIKVEDYGPKLQELQKSRASKVAAEEKKLAQAFIDKSASEAGAKKLPSGLIYSELTAGSGEMPKVTDTVKVNYRGTLTSGEVFDSSYDRGQPATFPLGGVIKCWTEGVQLMKVGGKSKLVCPSDIAYGDGGRPPKIKPGAALVFEVELLEIVKQAQQPALSQSGAAPGGQPTPNPANQPAAAPKG